MLYTKLVLEGYERFKLRNTRRIEMTVVENHVLIIGTNGCGKSSLLEELSPLPANAEEFSKDGCKIIELEHEGIEYRLSSTFQPRPKHSFIRIEKGMGVELNVGGTATAQRSLVSEILYYDDDIHAVMTGTARFTDMDKDTRQYWVMRLSGMNMDYALKLYQQLRTQHRDAVGTVKYLSKQIAEVSTRLLARDEITRRESEREVLHTSILALMGLKESNALSVADATQLQALTLESVARYNKQLSQILSRMPTEGISSKQEALSKVYHFEQVIEEITLQINQRYQVLEENSAVIEALGYFRVEDQQQLTATFNTLTANVEELLAQLHDDSLLEADLADLVLVRESYHVIASELTEIFMQMEQRYTQQDHDTSVKLLAQTRDMLMVLNQKLGVLEHQVQHYKDAEIATCPKCTHQWAMGFDEHTIKGSITAIENYTVEKYGLLGQIENLESEIQRELAYFALVRRLSALKKNFSKATLLWSTIQPYWEQEDFKSIPSRLDMLMHRISIRERLEVANSELMLVTHAMDSLRNEQDGRLKEVKQQWEKIHHEIEAETERQIQLRTYVKSLRQTIDLITQSEKYEDLLATELRTNDANILEVSKALRQQFLNTTIRRVQSDLARIESELVNIKNVEKTILNLETSKQQAEEQSIGLKILIDELSPVNGLIADSLTEFIASFAQQLTNIINSVWTYHMRVIPCGNSGGNLDYKFPLEINHGNKLSGDVRKTSMSQLAMVNLAFKLVMMFYLEMDDYPLMLDEVSPNLDEQHRINITQFIKEFVESKRCSQMFMVSHDANEAGSFYPHQFCIMDRFNIVQMEDYANSAYFKMS